MEPPASDVVAYPTSEETTMELDQALRFVGERTRGVLLTLKRDGLPQASNVAYATWDGAVHVSVTDDRAKTNNLRRDPRGALHVTSDDFWHWVVVEGSASVSPVTTEPGDTGSRLLRRVYEAVAGPHPDWDEFDRAMIDDRRCVISLRLDHAYGQLPG